MRYKVGIVSTDFTHISASYFYSKKPVLETIHIFAIFFVFICLCDQHTLNDEVDVGRTGLVSGLETACVGSLVCHHHSLNLNGEVAVVVVHQGDAGVQGPLICARK